MPARHPSAVGVDVIRAETLALADVADATDLATPVPTCGAWTMADLVWHLTRCELAPGLRTDTTIEAPSAELLLWLWGRLPDRAVSVSGDAEMAARLRATLAELA